jgi:uncharacterized membrane protein (UPF0182 family)
MSITQQPVKSSRLFLGHLHETAVKQLSEHFKKPEDHFKKVRFDRKSSTLIKTKFKGKKIFFKTGLESRELKDYIDLYEFASFDESYYQLMNELCDLTIESINLVLPVHDESSNIYITGGFSKNDLFLNLITETYPSKMVYTSEIANASALGAALVISGSNPTLNLGLTECKKTK